MRRPGTRRLLGRLAGAATASGLVLAGLVVAAAPASAAACSGTTGVTVVVDTGGSVSTRCVSGDPGTAMNALTAAGFSVTHPQQFPGSVVCRIDGLPASDPCVRMPPASAYWAFFHAKRGGGWVYSANGVATYDPAPGTVVGFRFGSGQQPRVAPPEPVATSKPAPPPSKPKATTSAPTSTVRKPSTTPEAGSTKGSGSSSSSAKARASTPGSGPGGTATPSASPSTTSSGPPSAGAGPSASASASASSTAAAATATDGGTRSPTSLAAAPTSGSGDSPSGLGTLLAGGALVALVAAGAGWAAWTRRT